jgi:hypothetical protein
MIDRIIESAMEQWEELWPGTSRPQDLHYVLQSRRRVILFLFDAQKKGSKLIGAVKISRRVEDNGQIERSVEVVGQVRRLLSRPILDTVPKAVLLNPVSGLSVSLEQGLPGEPLYLGRLSPMAMGRHRRNWEVWRQWLAEFQGQTAVGSFTVDASAIDKIVASSLQSVLNQEPAAPRIIDDFQKLTSDLVGLRLNAVWRYGDAHHSNILINKGRVSGVVDWEGAEADSWPTADWFQFAVQYLVDLYRVKYPGLVHVQCATKALDTLLRPADSSLASTVREQTCAFFSTHGLPTSTISAFLVVFLLQFHWPWDKKALIEHAHSILCG